MEISASAPLLNCSRNFKKYVEIMGFFYEARSYFTLNLIIATTVNTNHFTVYFLFSPLVWTILAFVKLSYAPQAGETQKLLIVGRCVHVQHRLLYTDTLQVQHKRTPAAAAQGLVGRFLGAAQSSVTSRCITSRHLCRRLVFNRHVQTAQSAVEQTRSVVVQWQSVVEETRPGVAQLL